MNDAELLASLADFAINTSSDIQEQKNPSLQVEDTPLQILNGALAIRLYCYSLEKSVEELCTKEELIYKPAIVMCMESLEKQKPWSRRSAEPRSAESLSEEFHQGIRSGKLEILQQYFKTCLQLFLAAISTRCRELITAKIGEESRADLYIALGISEKIDFDVSGGLRTTPKEQIVSRRLNFGAARPLLMSDETRFAMCVSQTCYAFISPAVSAASSLTLACVYGVAWAFPGFILPLVAVPAIIPIAEGISITSGLLARLSQVKVLTKVDHVMTKSGLEQTASRMVRDSLQTLQMGMQRNQGEIIRLSTPLAKAIHEIFHVSMQLPISAGCQPGSWQLLAVVADVERENAAHYSCYFLWEGQIVTRSFRYSFYREIWLKICEACPSKAHEMQCFPPRSWCSKFQSASTAPLQARTSGLLDWLKVCESDESLQSEIFYRLVNVPGRFCKSFEANVVQVKGE